MLDAGASVLFTAAALSGCGILPTDAPETVVRDVTQLVRVDVDGVARPTSTAEVQELLRTHPGPISIGGGRFSMGGQIASEPTLHLDLRGMDDVLAYDRDARRITVEAGITWRKIQERIDADELSVAIMQSYADFSVGGSLSVNGHGRYVNRGPVAHSVEALELVLADGSLVEASRTERPELFHAAIGGYGGIGLIATATLELADNARVARVHEVVDVDDYGAWFAEHIDGSEGAVFHNADLYPPDYARAIAITFEETSDPVTVPDRLQPRRTSTWLERTTYWAVVTLPGGLWAREHVLDPLRLRDPQVVWRNYEASYDVRTLEPRSRGGHTWVLQEMFVPVERFDDFVPRMREVFQHYDVQVGNVSIRHAEADPDTLLTWAPRDCFAFVIYYRQGTTRAEQTEVGVWTRALIDAVLDVEGTYYLPYQLHPRDDQLQRGYPRIDEWVALKAEVDPEYRFRNKLWDRYLPPPRTEEEQRRADIAARLAKRPDWQRPEDQTFLTLPEWFIVYSADELGSFLATRPQSGFPFFASIGQLQGIYAEVSAAVRGRYPVNTGYHAMIWVIGASYAVEYAAKGAWEGTVGRATEWWEGSGVLTTPEDQLYAGYAARYGAFLHHTPWYAYPYDQEFDALTQLPWTLRIRSLERKIAVGGELMFKGLWAAAMGAASAGAYGPQATEVLAWAHVGDLDPSAVDGVSVVEDLGGGDALLAIPRYEPFTTAIPALVEAGVELRQIAGNTHLLITLIAPAGWTVPKGAHEVHRWPILTQPGEERVALEVRLRDLDAVLAAVQAPARIDHLYDY